jgi:ADP-ribose pyrophosphatase YjhB (NUDIX family)
MRKTQSTGGVVLNKTGKVLVVDQTDSWSLPKGHIEKGEDRLAAAQREIYEESGISQLELVKDLGSYQRPAINNPNEHKTIFMFLFTTDQEDLNPVDPGNPEARWVSVDQVANHLTHEKDKEFFLSVKKISEHTSTG